MGNEADKGFHSPPPAYLRDIRIKTNRFYRDIAGKKSRESLTAPTRKEAAAEAVTELTKDSVKKFVISNPNFLDDLIANCISVDRIRDWLKGQDGGSQNQSAEDMERSFRHRQIMLITRSRLLYPFRYRKDEYRRLIERPFSNEYEEDIESHLFHYTEVPVEEINKVFILMVYKLLGKNAFPIHQLCYFLSELKCNYYNIEYHNYNHALSHAQSMYWILRKNPGVFNELEMKCLLIAALAHDAGHPGVNDSYLKATGAGLEKLYSSPILENHHLQTCFLILQDINCNVFCDLNGEDYKQVLDEIQHAILSTSINRYKVQCENMRHIIGTGLDFERKDVRDSAKSVLMMACDLCASWKEWNEHKSTVWALYKEFFGQGDREMQFQMESAPQMMRMNADKIPVYQVYFMENVILPVCQITSQMFPNISVILESTEDNLGLWNSFLSH